MSPSASAAAAASSAEAATPGGLADERGRQHESGGRALHSAEQADLAARAALEPAPVAEWPPFVATPALPAVLRWASELLDAQLGALVGRADATQPLRDLQVSSPALTLVLALALASFNPDPTLKLTLTLNLTPTLFLTPTQEVLVKPLLI